MQTLAYVASLLLWQDFLWPDRMWRWRRFTDCNQIYGATIRLFLFTAAFCNKPSPKEAKSSFGSTADIKSITCHCSSHGIHVTDIGNDWWDVSRRIRRSLWWTFHSREHRGEHLHRLELGPVYLDICSECYYMNQFWSQRPEKQQ